jgi:hypothetical protein
VSWSVGQSVTQLQYHVIHVIPSILVLVTTILKMDVESFCKLLELSFRAARCTMQNSEVIMLLLYC